MANDSTRKIKQLSFDDLRTSPTVKKSEYGFLFSSNLEDWIYCPLRKEKLRAKKKKQSKNS